MNKEKKERNNEIYEVWLQKKIGYKKLAKIFGLHYTTIAQIVRRTKERQGQGTVLDKGI